MRTSADLGLEEYLAAIAVARIVLGPRMRVQATAEPGRPRRVHRPARRRRGRLGRGLPAHPRPREPRAAWPSLERLRSVTEAAGFSLAERLTVHPEYVRAGEPWLDPRVSGHVAALATADGLAAPAHAPPASPGRSPTAASRSPPPPAAPTSTSPSTPTAAPPTAATTSTPSTATGPSSASRWPPVDCRAPGARRAAGRAAGARAHAAADERGDGGGPGVDGPGSRARNERGRVPEPPSAHSSADAPGRLDGDTRAALAVAESDPQALTDAQALTLMTADGAALREVARIADDLRRDVVGDDVTYVLNRNINFTNVCYTGCRFCAFAQRRTDADAYPLSLDEVADRAEQAWADGATEVCMQGGIDLEAPGTAYFDLAAAVKARVPAMHVHAFSPMEVVNGATLPACRSVTGWCARSPGWTPSPARPRRSWTTTCAGS